ncbi:MAG: hypothetical protein ACKVH8_23745 [Pirellulales bacterium]
MNDLNKRSEKSQGLFYTRDSGGKHESTPSEYVNWAIQCCENLGLDFSVLPSTIDSMIQNGQSRNGDIFLDYGVSGNILARKGLDELKAAVVINLNVSHVLIPRRNRLARPDNPMDGIKLEN